MPGTDRARRAGPNRPIGFEIREGRLSIGSPLEDDPGEPLFFGTPLFCQGRGPNLAIEARPRGFRRRRWWERRGLDEPILPGRFSSKSIVRMNLKGPP